MKSSTAFFLTSVILYCTGHWIGGTVVIVALTLLLIGQWRAS